MSSPTQQAYPDDAWQQLNSFLTEGRREKLESAARQRTQHIRLVVQDVHNPHNVSACLRSAEAFGILSVDIVTLKKTSSFRPSTVARGVSHWLNLSPYESVEECATALKQEGFVLAGAYPKKDALPLGQVPIDKPLAVVFGNEHEGLDLGWHEHLDCTFHIPMVGLVESLNISVSAAVALYDLRRRAEQELPAEVFLLADCERNRLLSQWVCKHFQNWQEMLKRTPRPS